ncbi:uncharacterized protein METZ01_LOCUS482375, partial [marine metagenome]
QHPGIITRVHGRESFRVGEAVETDRIGCLGGGHQRWWHCDADILEEGWLAPDEEVARELERLRELVWVRVTDGDEFQAARKRLLDPGTSS